MAATTTKPKTTADKLKQHFDGVLRSGEILRMFPEDIVLVEDPADWLYDERIEEPLKPEFVADIKERGVQDPVTVYQDGEVKGVPQMKVVDGTRRLRAARLVNKDLKPADRVTIPFRIMRGEQLNILEWKSAANAHREGESYYTKAKKIQRLMAHGANKTRCMRCMGLGSTSEVDKLLAYLEMSAETRAVFDKNVNGTQAWPMAVVEAVAAVPASEQPAVIQAVKDLGATKAHEIPAAIEHVRSGKDKKDFERPGAKKMLARKKLEDWRNGLPKTGRGSEARAALTLMLGYQLPKEFNYLITPKEKDGVL